MEEISRTYFSKTLSIESKKSKENDKDIKIGLSIYSVLLKLQVLFGFYFVFFGTHYTQLLLRILYNSEKATVEAAQLLSVYCMYIPFMGVNGVSEAFLQGIGNASVITKQTTYLVLFWFIFLATFLGTFSLFGISSLVIANACNLFFRILFSFSFAVEFFKERNHSLSWRDLFPERWSVWIGFLSSFFIISYVSSSHMLVHLGTGVLLGILQLLNMYIL